MSTNLYFMMLPKEEADKLIDLMDQKNISPEAQLVFAQVLGCQFNNMAKGKDYPSVLVQWDLLKDVFPKVGQIHAKELAADNFFTEVKVGKSLGFRVSENLFQSIIKNIDKSGKVNFTDYIIERNRQNTIARITVKEYEELKSVIQALREKVGV